MLTAATSLHHCQQPEAGRGLTRSVSLLQSELSLTALVARALDRLLFDEESVATGVCLHQGPTRKQSGKQGAPESADIYIAQLRKHKPSTPVLVSDMKIHDIEHAAKETLWYSVTLAEIHHRAPTFPVLLALPATATEASLEVPVAMHQRMWRSPLCKASLTDKALLSTVYAAVKYQCTYNRDHKEAPTCMCP